MGKSGFNLVIEVLLISSLSCGSYPKTSLKVGFQSRNRGSFDFKSVPTLVQVVPQSVFQSRNRGSFDFKYYGGESERLAGLCFNLVIEVLLISRNTLTWEALTI